MRLTKRIVHEMAIQRCEEKKKACLKPVGRPGHEGTNAVFGEVWRDRDASTGILRGYFFCTDWCERIERENWKALGPCRLRIHEGRSDNGERMRFERHVRIAESWLHGWYYLEVFQHTRPQLVGEEPAR